MRKTIYSIFALSTLLFSAASCSEDRGTTTEVVDSNEDEHVNPAHIRGYGDAEPGGTPPYNPEADQMYGFDRDNFSQQVTADMGVQGDVATEMVKVYYDRSRQLSELAQRYKNNSTATMGGQSTDSATMNASQQPMSQEQMETERQRIDDETDQKVKGLLTPEQYKTYQQNRSKYNTMPSGNQ